MRSFFHDFSREVLRPLLHSMAGGAICAAFAVAAVILSALIFGPTPWNLLAGVFGFLLGGRLATQLLPLAS